MKTIESEDGEKLSARVPVKSCWEYRCNGCKQLRLYAAETKPTSCQNCESTDLTIGRPGELPTRRTSE